MKKHISCRSFLSLIFLNSFPRPFCPFSGSAVVPASGIQPQIKSGSSHSAAPAVRLSGLFAAHLAFLLFDHALEHVARTTPLLLFQPPDRRPAPDKGHLSRPDRGVSGYFPLFPQRKEKVTRHVQVFPLYLPPFSRTVTSSEREKPLARSASVTVRDVWPVPTSGLLSASSIRAETVT